VHVVHNGVEATRFRPIDRSDARGRLGLDDRQWVVGFVGRLDPCKDVGFSIDAAAHGGLGPDGRLLIVGSGPDRANLLRLAEHQGISSQVTWVDRINDPTPAYAAMDVMVLPSLYEIFGNCILEAMAQSVPVLARRRDGSPDRLVLTASEELIEHGRTGIVVDPHDPADLAQQLSGLRGALDRCRTMGQAAQHFARHHTWDQAIRRHLSSAPWASVSCAHRDTSQPIIRAA
jgi:glycosyltransferase involved in cell wall biosynthesis